MKSQLFFVGFLFICHYSLGQFNDYTNSNLVIGFSGAYSSMMADAPAVSVVGGAATAFGVGYELQKNYLLFQTGVEISYASCRMNRTDVFSTQSLIDSDGDPYKGLFTFSNIHSKQKTINTAIPILVGFKMDNGFYILGGAKLLFNLAGNGNTISTVNTEAQYSNIIGDNDNGVIGNMPNHGLGTVTRAATNSFKLNPGYAASFEFGLSMNSALRGLYSNGTKTYRLSLFCDYGFHTINTTNNINTLIVNTSTSGGYQPAINGFLFYGNAINKINTLQLGVKFSILLGGRKKVCRCLTL